MKIYNFTAQIEFDTETKQYYGFVPELLGAHTHADTLDELNQNLREVIELCVGELTNEELTSMPQVIGFQQFSVLV